MAKAIERVGPCTLIPNPQFFETLVDAIISQQISVKAADAIMGRLRSALHAEADGTISPNALLSLEEDTLRAVGLSPQKMRYIRDLTERVANGELDLERLSELDDEEVIQRVGESKRYWSLDSRDDADFFDWVDQMSYQWMTWDFWRACVRHIRWKPDPTPKEMRVKGELWHPYRTFATWYMWGVQRLKLGNERQKTRIVSL